MAFKEAGSWKVGPDGMYTLSYDPEEPDSLLLDWNGKCFMYITIDEEDSADDFHFDETDLRWMECYKPWLQATVQGKNQAIDFYESEKEAMEAARKKHDELQDSKASFYVEKVDGAYYYEEGRGYLLNKITFS